MKRHFEIHFAPRSGFHGAKAAAGDIRQPWISPTPAAASIQTARVGLSGGNLERPLSRLGTRNTGAESLAPFPRGSLIDPGNPLLESDDFIDAMRDCCRVVGAALFLTVTGLALVASVFITFFVDLG